MNRARLLTIGCDVERYGERYDQSCWGPFDFDPAGDAEQGYSCETAGCIAGFTVARYRHLAEDALRRGASIEEAAREILDLDRDEGARLFAASWPEPWLKRARIRDEHADSLVMGSASPFKRFVPDPDVAGAVCRHMARQGRIWDDYPTKDHPTYCPQCDGRGGDNHLPCPGCERVGDRFAGLGTDC